MMQQPEQLQSNTLLLVNEFSDALRFVKSIVPYYDGKNVNLMEELKSKLKEEWNPEGELYYKLENKLEISTKYYEAKTNIIIISYDSTINIGITESIERLQKDKMNFDSIFFFATALAPKKILGHDKYCQVVNEYTSQFSPQIQTLIYQKTEDFEVDIDYIIKQEEELESYTESVFDDFIKLSEQDNIIKPRAKSMLEETEGITRIIDILESSVWVGSEMKEQEKNKTNQPVSSSSNNNSNQLNIHLPTYQKNQDLRDKYDTYLDKDDNKEGVQKNQEKQENSKKSVQEEQDEENKNDAIIKKEEKEILENKKEEEIVKNESSEKTQVQQDNKTEEKKVETINKEQEKQASTTTAQKEKPKKEKLKKDIIDNDDEEGQENNLNDFMKILQQMKGMKEQSGNLSDEQRKNQAEKFVLGLMEAFGLDEESEDDQ